MWKITKWRILQGVLCIAVILSVLVSALNLSVAWRSQDGDALTVGADAKVITIGIAGEVYAAGTPDYSTDGVADDVQFQLALNALPANGGKIVLLAGNYSLSANVTRALANVTWQGMGRGSYLALDGVNPIITAGGNNWVFQDLRTDAGGFGMGATTGWMWTNVTINATYWAYRSPYGTSVVNDLTAASVTDSGLTSGRVPIAGVGGLLGDDADLTFDGTRLQVGGANVVRSATLVVAASDADAQSIAQADYVADGVADDVEINAAIAALPANGGTVSLSEGTFYLAASVDIDKDGITLRGQNTGGQAAAKGTRLWVPINTNINAIAFSGGARWNTIIESLMIEFHTTQASGNGIVIDGGRATTIRDVLILNPKDAGIYNSVVSASDWTVIDNVYVTGGVYGYEFLAGAQIFIGNSYAFNPSGAGYYIQNASGIYVNQSVYDGNGGVGGWGILVGGSSSNISLTNNLIYGTKNGSAGIYVSGGLIAGNFETIHIKNNQLLALGHNGIEADFFTRTVTDLQITGNTIEDLGIGKYPITWSSTGGNANIVGLIISQNSFRGVNTIPLFDASVVVTSSQIIENQNYITPGESRFASGTLTAGLANAIAFAWHNPEAQDILVKKVVVEITTGSVTAGSEIDVGIADDAAGTNRGTEFFNNLDANDVDINDSWVVGDGGTQTKWVFAQDSVSATDGWVVGQILTADAAALVGRWYIEFVGR